MAYCTFTALCDGTYLILQEGFPDNSYFAPDCFHFSQKSHSQAARGLWNNMVRF